jgi:hypothetical protein
MQRAPSSARWAWFALVAVACAGAGFVAGVLHGAANASAPAPPSPRTGYQRDDPAGLQPTMRAMAVATLAVQANLDRGAPRPAEPFARAMADNWDHWRARRRGPMDPHAFGDRFEPLSAQLAGQLRALEAHARGGDLDAARGEYARVISTCLTCHHGAARGDGVQFGRIAGP